MGDLLLLTIALAVAASNAGQLATPSTEPSTGLPGRARERHGYVAIALALLGGLRPSGVIAAALLYGALTAGAESMVVETGIPLALLTVIVALAIMFAAAPQLTRSIWRLGPPKPGAELGANTPVDPAATT